MQIQGNVVSGVGEGGKYVKEYLPHFEQVLGFTCFPGTLNLKVFSLPDLSSFEKFSVVPEGLGKVDCYLVKIAGMYDGAIVIPHETRHGKEIVELVAPVDLREELKLQDGDEVVCELE
jgi:riboflavin kinase, archaea type